MAELIQTGAQTNMTKIQAGCLYLVKNCDKRGFSNAKSQYYAIWIENDEGKEERALLMTARELGVIEQRSLNNPEDKLSYGRTAGTAIRLKEAKAVKGRFIPVYNKNKKYWMENNHYYGVLIQDPSGVDLGCYLFTQAEIKKMAKRATKNPNTVPSKSFLTDLFD